MCEKGCVDTVHITGLIYRTTVHIDNVSMRFVFLFWDEQSLM